MTATRVAYLAKRFPRLSETFVLNEILELRRRGLDLVTFALMDPLEKMVHPAAAALQPEVTYLHDPAHPFRSWWRLLGGAALQALARPHRALRLLCALVSVHRSAPSVRHAVEGLWLARDLRKRGASHLHAHFAHSPAAVAYMARLAGGPPFSFTAHAKDLYTTLPRNLRIRAKASTCVVTCTEFNRRHLEALLSGTPHPTVHVVHHGTDIERFTPEHSSPRPGRILSVGRLVPKKGYTTLIAALGLLAERGIDFSCDIFGGGPQRDELAGEIEGRGLEARVRLHGPRMQEDILRAYRSASIFALAPVVTDDGDRDGIPNVLVEAMACGIPVVSTRISGIPELVDDGDDGLLVDPGNPQALADALQSLLEDAALRAKLGAAGRLKVEDLFDLTRNTGRLLELFAGQTEPLASGVGVAVP